MPNTEHELRSGLFDECAQGPCDPKRQRVTAKSRDRHVNVTLVTLDFAARRAAYSVPFDVDAWSRPGIRLIRCFCCWSFFICDSVVGQRSMMPVDMAWRSLA